MDNKKRILITVGIGIILIIGFYFITKSITKYTGYFVSDEVLDAKDDFKACLEKQDITLYINTQNPSATLSRIKARDYLDSIDIFNCLREKETCLKDGISLFPSWSINENKIDKDITISELARYSGCKF